MIEPLVQTLHATGGKESICDELSQHICPPMTLSSEVLHLPSGEMTQHSPNQAELRSRSAKPPSFSELAQKRPKSF